MDNTPVAQTTTTPIEPMPPPPKNYLKFILAGLIILAVFISGGLFLGKTIYAPKTPLTIQPTVTLSQTATPTIIPTTDPTANWKTYINKQYGFQFDYPRNGVLASGNPPYVTGECGKAIKENLIHDNSPAILFDNFFYIIIKEWLGNISDFMKANNAENVWNVVLTTKNNVDEAVALTGLSDNYLSQSKNRVYEPPPLSYVSHILKKGNRLFLFLHTQNPGNMGGCVPQNSSALDQILSTFKFL